MMMMTTMTMTTTLTMTTMTTLTMMLTMMFCVFRFRLYELSFKTLCELFDWWERAVGALSASYVAEQQADLPDDKGAKKGRRATGFYFICLLYSYSDRLPQW